MPTVTEDQLDVSELLDDTDIAPATAPATGTDEKPRRARRGRPPKAGTAPAGGAGTAPGRERKPRTRKTAPTSTRHVADSVAALHQLGGGLLLPAIGKPRTGQHLIDSAEQAGELWAALAKRYPLIAKIFGAGGDGILLVQLVMLYAPIVTTAMSEKPGGPAVPDLSGLLATMAPAAPTGD